MSPGFDATAMIGRRSFRGSCVGNPLMRSLKVPQTRGMGGLMPQQSSQSLRPPFAALASEYLA